MYEKQERRAGEGDAGVGSLGWLAVWRGRKQSTRLFSSPPNKLQLRSAIIAKVSTDQSTCQLQQQKCHIWRKKIAMLSESFVSSIRAQPRAPNTAIAKDVGIYLHELHPTPAIKSSFKKSSALANTLAVSSTHIFAPQADKAIVHVYSREKGNQESLISFPERIHSATLVGDGVLVLGTAEGRVILWEVSVPESGLIISS